jgi:hypothetical protein
MGITLCAACGSGGNNDGNCGSSSRCDASWGGNSGAACTTPLTIFDNWNTAACSPLTDTSSFTLGASTFVTSLDLWISTTVAGADLQYSLSGVGMSPLSGLLDKGSCDPIQSAWCTLSARLNKTLATGTYTIKISSQAICSNVGSSNAGFVRVLGCATQAADSGIAPTPDAASTGGYVGACDSEPQCIDYLSAPAGEAARLQSQCTSLYYGTWRTSPRCTGTWCGHCTLTTPGQISYAAHYTICSAELVSQCQALGGKYTAP